jgi:hypothetical protein
VPDKLLAAANEVIELPFCCDCSGPVMAQLGRADHHWICPFMGVKRSCRLRARNDANDPLQTRAAYCCDLLSSSRSRTSSDMKRSARCHASSLSPRNVKNFLNTTRWDVVSMATVHTSCTSVLLV